MVSLPSNRNPKIDDRQDIQEAGRESSFPTVSIQDPAVNIKK